MTRGIHLTESLVEAGELLTGEFLLRRVVCAGQVGERAFQLEAGAGDMSGQRHGLRGVTAQPVHSGVHLEVHPRAGSEGGCRINARGRTYG